MSHPTTSAVGPEADVNSGAIMELLKEDTAGIYEISGEIGRGGMAFVFLATETSLGRRVAIKVLPPDLTYGPGMVERFKREARTSATLDHPNIIPVYRVSSGGKLFWYSMKYFEGRSLERYLAETGPLSMDVALRIIDQVADALDFAHERGVIHRDMKPANVLLDARRRAIVTDFGIAKAVTAGTITTAGAVLGTPHYMAPEQWDGKNLTGATDQYACAVMMYQMLLGRLPFQRDSLAELMSAHVTQIPDFAPLRARVGAEIARVMSQAFAKDPELRYRTVSAFVEQLHKAAATAPAAEPPASPVPPRVKEERELLSTEVITTRLEPVASKPDELPTVPIASKAAEPVSRTNEPADARVTPPRAIPPEGVPRPRSEPQPRPQPARVESPRAQHIRPRIRHVPNITPIETSDESNGLKIAAVLLVVIAAAAGIYGWIKNSSTPVPAATASLWRLPVRASSGLPDGGVEHTCAITEGSKAICWGGNTFGQLGDTIAPQGLPVLVSTDSVRQVVAGDNHTCALDTTGSVWCWGDNTSGQLGSVTTLECRVGTGRRTPCSATPVAGPSVKATSITAGGSHTCALEERGRAICWGNNYQGQLGSTSRETSVPVLGNYTFATVAAGGSHTCGIVPSGILMCWGSNQFGQLGTRSRDERCGPTPQTQVGCSRQPLPVASQGRFTSVSAGGAHTCALARDGQAFCWGSNRVGQLGTGTTEDSPVPFIVRGGRRYTAIATGRDFTCALAIGNTVWCWGSNADGQLGTGSEATIGPEPVQVALDVPARSLGTGAAHACVVQQNNRVSCWGTGTAGQLGATRSSRTPASVSPELTANRR